MGEIRRVGTTAQSGLVTFDPGASVLIKIDHQPRATRCIEAGFRFLAPRPEVAFAPDDDVDTTGSDALRLLAGSAVNFSALGGGHFSLLRLDCSGDVLVEG